MQIELIGCTSAGKSTLAQSILHACHEPGTDIFLGNDFVLRQVSLDGIKSRLPRTLLIDLIALFACLATWRGNLQLYLFAARLLVQLPIAPFEKLNLLRNVLKKIGIHEIIRSRSTAQQVILVDEGVLQAAHNLFVHVSARVKTEDLATFARLVPLPDVVVYLRQPQSLLIERTMKRGHKRIPNLSDRDVGCFVETAVATFDELVQYPTVESKLVIVDGGERVVVAPRAQGDPSIDLALRIIRSGIAIGIPGRRIPEHPQLVAGLATEEGS